MSDTAKVFTDLTVFSTRLGTLLSSSAAERAAGVARKLRLERQLEAALQALITVFDLLARATQDLNGPLAKAAGVAAGCQAIADSLDAFGDGEGVREMAKRCGQSEAMVEPIVDTIQTMQGPLAQALKFFAKLPKPSDLGALHGSLSDLRKRLSELHGEVKEPKTSTAIASPLSAPQPPN